MRNLGQITENLVPKSTIHANFRAIRAWFYKAIDTGLVQQSQNPFFSFKLKSGSSNRIRLTKE